MNSNKEDHSISRAVKLREVIAQLQHDIWCQTSASILQEFEVHHDDEGVIIKIPQNDAGPLFDMMSKDYHELTEEEKELPMNHADELLKAIATTMGGSSGEQNE